ncbi:hypothetical protein C8F01DRAFT_1099112 [Mycena amicta]|nr:hypothetical protein C8F01DRAFT_1099112 [Mycena amicta]
MALSSSTTETKTYILEKYSRAYSSNKKDNGGSEWQHFTNPVLRLVLDTKMSQEKAESFRLRVVWTMNGSSAASQDVVLEDLDLLSFSSLGDSFKSESSPLKGVYRDTTFGLRYLYVPDSSDAHKVYRRFQVSFPSSVATLQLVDVIRNVCPCKTTEPSKKTTAVQQLQDSAIGWETQPPRPNPNPPPTRFQAPTMHFLEPSSLNPYRPSSPEMPPSSPVEPEATVFSQAPPPTPPAATPDVLMPPPPAPPPPVSSRDPDAEADKLVEALRDATRLYDLSYAQLTRLVGDVVREDGFARLVRRFFS